MTRPNHTMRRAIGPVLARGATLLLVALLVFGEAACAIAITRDTVMARAQRWVDLEVPYSQSASFEGYRTDCSGFVSMAWSLKNGFGQPISPATDRLPDFGVPITKDQLRRGDMIVRPKTATTWGHAVIFGGWADDEKATYWAYEQSGSARRARMRQTPYPFWPSAGLPFTPYRYKGITPDHDFVTRVYGSDRYATAAAASLRTFSDPAEVDTVVLATGESWPDALGGAGLAGAVGGPVLLTSGNALPAPIRRELARLKPDRVLVLGGSSAVAEEVLAQAASASGGSVERIAGQDRYATAAAVADRLIAELSDAGREFDGAVYLATGDDFADALSVSPVSAHRARPVLLVRREQVPAATAAAIERLDATRVHIIGGNAAIAPVVATRVEASGATVNRIHGADRYRTALAVARHGLSAGLTRTEAGIATGASFADALAAGAALGQATPPAVLYLAPPARLDSELRRTLWDHRLEIGVAHVYGGPAALSPEVMTQLAAALGG